MTSTLNPAVNGRASTERADYRLLRVGLWSVCVYVGLGGLLGFAVFAGFWPPPSEDLDAAGIAAYFHEHQTSIRIGMVLMAVGPRVITPGASSCRSSSAGWRVRWGAPCR